MKISYTKCPEIYNHWPNNANPCEILRWKSSLLKFWLDMLFLQKMLLNQNIMWQHCMGGEKVVITNLGRQIVQCCLTIDQWQSAWFTCSWFGVWYLIDPALFLFSSLCFWYLSVTCHHITFNLNCIYHGNNVSSEIYKRTFPS